MAQRTFGTANGSLASTASWKEGIVPVAGDDVTYPQGAGNITGGYDALGSALTGSGRLNSVTVEPGNTSLFGDADNNVEFDTDAFRFAGQGQAYIDLLDSPISPIIENSAERDTGTYGLYLVGTSLLDLILKRGAVGLAARAGEVATVNNVNVSYITKKQADAILKLGSGVSVGSGTLDINQTGGIILAHCDLGNVEVFADAVFVQVEGNYTTLDLRGGKAFPDANGTYPTTRIYKSGQLLNTRDTRAKNMTNITVYAGGIFTDPDGNIITAAGNFSLPDGLENVNINRGKNITI